MRLSGRQARFLFAVLACWTMARAYWLWPIAVRATAGMGAALAARAPTPPFATSVAPVEAAATPVPSRIARAADRPAGRSALPAAAVLLPLFFAARADDARAEDRPAMPAPAPSFPPQTRRPARIEAQAYLFWRPGGRAVSLAEHGELGGSQFAARIAVPLGGGLAAAGRIYAPLEHPGAEAAVGVDWHPLSGTPLRISVERRQRLDALGRSAWSAYAAGGFWRGGGPGTAQIDGYAQAGVVGTQRRDLFIDGAVRIGYRLPTPKLSVTVGAGVWGAAQPQVSRVDAGPRLAVVLPVDGHALTLAIDGRFRMAGHAAPGSGAALTLASDF